MQIKKDNLVIRSAEVADAEKLTNWWNDGAVMAHAGFPNGLGQAVEETIEQIRRNETHLSQLCIMEIDGVSVGEMSFYLTEEGVAEFGIKICESSYQNHGSGTQFIKMILEYLFKDKTLNEEYLVEKVVFDTNLKNVRAQHVYEKIGFVRLRENHHAWKNQLGEWQDSVDYEMTRERYLSLIPQ